LRTSVGQRIRDAIAILAIPGILLPAFATNAMALTYDGTDPQSTGCSNSAFTATGPKNVDYGTLEERFSTSCQTAWARFTCKQSGGCTNFVFWIHRVNDGLDEDFYMTYPASMGNGTQRWSPQLYDGAGYEAYACFQRYFGGQVECNPVY
jgi:hypothetical protein